MDRRAFVTGVRAVLAAPLVASALAQKRPTISILHSGYPERTPIERLFEALREMGYDQARTAIIELLGGRGDPARLKALVAEVIARRPDVVIAITSPAVLALKEAGATMPVVFAFVVDPVALGVVQSLERPGGNFTGITYSDAPLAGKRLELLSEALPNVRRVAVIWSPTFPDNAAYVDAIRRSASARRIEILSRTLRGAEDLATAFDDVARDGAQAVIFVTDNVMFGRRKEVAALTLAHHLPSIHNLEAEVRDGGLMSYGADVNENYRRAAALVDRILKGARPADLPVEEPTRFTLAINRGTARALGLTIPPYTPVRTES